MELKIQNTKEETVQLLNVIVYGESGVGKTSLIKQLPAEETLILSAEGGLLSVRDHGVDYVVVKSIADVMSVLKQVEATKYKHVAIEQFLL